MDQQMQVLKLKISKAPIKASMAALGFMQRSAPQMPQDKMEMALDALRNSDAAKRFHQLSKSGELFAFDKN